MRNLIAAAHTLHFWLILLFFSLCTVSHYLNHLPFTDIAVDSLLGFERHAAERILFLVPITYAGMVFGAKGGICYLAFTLAVLLPRSLFLSSYPKDALFETFTIILIGATFTWWRESHRREVGKREQALLRLESIRNELNSYIQTIREGEKRLSILHSITTAVNQFVALDEVLSTAADKIKETIETQGVLIFILNENNEDLCLRAHRGISSEFARQLEGLKVGEGFNGWVAETGKPCLIDDSSADPRLSREIVRTEGIGSQFIVPLLSEEKVVGTLCAAAQSIKYFTKEEKDLLILIGYELGVAVQKAALYEESERVAKRYRELFEKAHDAIWVHDLEGTISTANRATADLTGYGLEELIGKKASELLLPEGLNLAREVRQRLLSGKEIVDPYEQRILRRDGSQAIVMLATSLLGGDGMPYAFQNIARDVSKERALQANLQLYVHQITKAHEEERKRIARELHDDSIQVLVVLSRRLDDLISHASKSSRVTRNLEEIREAIDEIISGIRRSIQDLRPPTLEYLGLIPALRELISQLNEQTETAWALHITGVARQFTPESELMIYRIVQEALTNIRKHSNAQRAKIDLHFHDDEFTIKICDDGTGVSISEDAVFLKAGKVGIAGIRERANLLGAGLTIDSAPDHGTNVTLVVPYPSLLLNQHAEIHT